MRVIEGRDEALRWFSTRGVAEGGEAAARQVDAIIDQADRLLLHPIHSPRVGQPDSAPLRIKGGALPRTLLENPHAWVAQPTLESVPLPSAPRPTPFRALAKQKRGGRFEAPGGVEKGSV